MSSPPRTYKFGDVVEWDIRGGVIRWFIVSPSKWGDGYNAVWMSGGDAKWELTEMPDDLAAHRLVSDE